MRLIKALKLRVGETLPVVVPNPEDVLDDTEELDEVKDTTLVLVIEDVIVADGSDDVEAERVRVKIDDCVQIAEDVCDFVKYDVPDDVPVSVFSLDGLDEIEILAVDEAVNVPSVEIEAEALIVNDGSDDVEAECVRVTIDDCVPMTEDVCDFVTYDVPDDVPV